MFRPFVLLLLKLGVAWFEYLIIRISTRPYPSLPENSAKHRWACVCFFVFNFHPGRDDAGSGTPLRLPPPPRPLTLTTTRLKTLPHWFSPRHKGPSRKPASLSLYKEFMHALRFPTKHKVVGYTGNCLELVFLSHTNSRVITYFQFFWI